MRYGDRYRFYVVRLNESGSIEMCREPLYAANHMDRAHDRARRLIEKDPHLYREGLVILENVMTVKPIFSVEVVQEEPAPVEGREIWDVETETGEDQT